MNKMHLDNSYALMLVDGRGFIRFASRGAEHLLGYSPGWLLGKGIDRVFVADILSCFRSLDSTETTEHQINVQTECLDSSLAHKTVDLTAETISLEGIPAILLCVNDPDSSSRRERECNLHQFEIRIADSTNAVFITDETGRIVFVNKVFERLSGFSGSEACGRDASAICCGLALADVYKNLWAEIQRNGEYRGVLVHRKKMGELYHEATNVRPFVDCNGNLTHLIFSGTDVSRDIQELEHLKHLASHDALTDLPNRVLFKDRLDQAFAHSNRYGTGFVLCFVDVDRLKAINDQYGHAAGDASIQTVARILKNGTRQEDTVARLGGDEFALILPGVAQRRHAEKIARKILSILRQQTLTNTNHCKVSVSIGMCSYPQDGRDEETLLTRADQAMYLAKESGGDAYCFFGAEPISKPIPQRRKQDGRGGDVSVHRILNSP